MVMLQLKTVVHTMIPTRTQQFTSLNYREPVRVRNLSVLSQRIISSQANRLYDPSIFVPKLLNQLF